MAVVDLASPRGPAEKQPQILRRCASQDDNAGEMTTEGQPQILRRCASQDDNASWVSFEGDWNYAGFVFEPGP
jgi:hypothetical protein